MVSSRTGYNTLIQLLLSEVGHLIVGAADFEREDGLGVLSFEKDRIFQVLTRKGGRGRR
jgi:hypothetical protein